MRLFGKRKEKDDNFELTVAAHPPWALAGFAIVLGLFGAAAAAGVAFPPARYPILLPVGVALVAMWVVGRIRPESSLAVAEHGGRKEVILWSTGRSERIDLNDLASVSREPEGDPPALTLTELHGAHMTIPLGVWTDEDRLLLEVEEAARKAGASGTAGSPVPVHKPGWIGPARIGIGLAMLIPLAVIVSASPGRGVEDVTRERLERTEGVSTSPLAGITGCDIYVVPLDRPSELRVSDLARTLARKLPVSVCPTPSLAFDKNALDEGREQLDAWHLIRDLKGRLQIVFGNRQSTVVGVTEMDLFSSNDRSLSFTFGSAYHDSIPQGIAALSTARMGDGEDRDRRLETMAMRYIGFNHFGLAESSDKSSALYPSIRGRGDLDRMRPEFSDPPPTDAELQDARVRFLEAVTS